MLVQWCDQNDNTAWTPSDTNTAGSRNLVGGSELLFGMRTRFGNLIFSDASVFAMVFVGGLNPFGFETIASGASGLIGPRAAVEVNSVAYWMGLDNFYIYDGTVRPMKNSKDIRRFVFDNVNRLQRGKIFASANTLYNEIYFFYCDTDSDEINRYVKRSEEHTSELQSLMRSSYAVFCLKNQTSSQHVAQKTTKTNYKQTRK